MCWMCWIAMPVRRMRCGPDWTSAAKTVVIYRVCRLGRAVPWDGVELDAHRRYWTLTTRRAHGEWVAHALPECRYLAGNLLDLHGGYSFITWFLPFLHAAPLRIWGLPDRFLMPRRLLDHAWTLLAPGGRLLVINQGESEVERQAELFEQAGIVARALGRIESPLSPFQRPRYGFMACRPYT